MVYNSVFAVKNSHICIRLFVGEDFLLTVHHYNLYWLLFSDFQTRFSFKKVKFILSCQDWEQCSIFFLSDVWNGSIHFEVHSSHLLPPDRAHIVFSRLINGK